MDFMKRYMDDVITITAKDDSVWDVDRFREDFRRSECYWAPLKLEAAESAHFLETTLELDPPRNGEPTADLAAHAAVSSPRSVSRCAPHGSASTSPPEPLGW